MKLSKKILAALSAAALLAAGALFSSCSDDEDDDKKRNGVRETARKRGREPAQRKDVATYKWRMDIQMVVLRHDSDIY